MLQINNAFQILFLKYDPKSIKNEPQIDAICSIFKFDSKCFNYEPFLCRCLVDDPKLEYGSCINKLKVNDIKFRLNLFIKFQQHILIKRVENINAKMCIFLNRKIKKKR